MPTVDTLLSSCWDSSLTTGGCYDTAAVDGMKEALKAAKAARLSELQSLISTQQSIIDANSDPTLVTNATT